MAKHTILFAVALAALVCAPLRPSRAESFVQPAMDNILKTLIRFGTLDIRNDSIVDMYASIIACDIYKDYYRDEFKWRKIREIMRESIRKEINVFPTGYRYDTKLQLGRYDFKRKIYSFSSKTTQIGVNVFNLATHESDFCGQQEGFVLPKNYKLVLDHPTIVTGLPMSEADGQKLLERMEKAGNTDRLVYVRFNIQVIYVAPFMKEEIQIGHNLALKEGKKRFVIDEPIRLDGRLDSIEYYEDPEHTRPIYKFIP